MTTCWRMTVQCGTRARPPWPKCVLSPPLHPPSPASALVVSFLHFCRSGRWPLAAMTHPNAFYWNKLPASWFAYTYPIPVAAVHRTSANDHRDACNFHAVTHEPMRPWHKHTRTHSTCRRAHRVSLYGRDRRKHTADDFIFDLIILIKLNSTVSFFCGALYLDGHCRARTPHTTKFTSSIDTHTHDSDNGCDGLFLIYGFFELFAYLFFTVSLYGRNDIEILCQWKWWTPINQHTTTNLCASDVASVRSSPMLFESRTFSVYVRVCACAFVNMKIAAFYK